MMKTIFRIGNYFYRPAIFFLFILIMVGTLPSCGGGGGGGGGVPSKPNTESDTNSDAPTAQTGALKATITPQEAVDSGAQWQVDGGDWKNSGVTVEGLDEGQHVVSYKAADGYIEPTNQNVNITTDKTTSTTGNYEPQTLGLVQTSDDIYSLMPAAAPPSDGLTDALLSLPAVIDLSVNLPTARSQGGQGSCVAWAVGYGLKTYQEKVERDWSLDQDSHLFSPAFIYHQRTNSESQGMYIWDAFSIIKLMGDCFLSTMPYDQNDDSSSPSQAAFDEADDYKIETSWRIRRIEGQFDLTEVKTFLSKGYPLVGAIEVYPDFGKLRDNNPVYNSYGGDLRGYHAILVCGYDDINERFKVLNSWGTTWGASGYFYAASDILMGTPNMWCTQ